MIHKTENAMSYAYSSIGILVQSHASSLKYITPSLWKDQAERMPNRLRDGIESQKRGRDEPQTSISRTLSHYLSKCMSASCRKSWETTRLLEEHSRSAHNIDIHQHHQGNDSE